MDNKGKSTEDVQRNASLKGNAYKAREATVISVWLDHCKGMADWEDGISPAKARL